jgi:AcrR family transcriptional regulator
VRRGLIEAGLALARAGGPDAVLLREAARQVGVAPNAAYRHFANRDALLNAVCLEAMRAMAQRMEDALARVALGHGTPQGALGRLRALGVAYLEFALTEPGLFATAFAVPRHLEYATGDVAARAGERPPFQLLGAVLDELVTPGVLPSERRPQAEYVVWSCVHGLAMLVSQGPLRQLPPSLRTHLSELLFAFIARGL